MPRLKILFVASECAPIVMTGGLADVVGALPLALHERGHDVRVLMPRYREAKALDGKRLPFPLEVPTGAGSLGSAVWETKLDGRVPLYLLEHDQLFDRPGVYGNGNGNGNGEYADNMLRFALLSRAAFELCRVLPFQPDVLHAHDWPTALVPVYSALLGAELGPAGQAATVLTIHNQGYQGRFAADQYRVLGLGPEHLHPGLLEFYGGVNLLKAGLVTATQLSTVSPCYAQELQTPEGGVGLEGVMQQRRSDLVGILNGIDEDRWDPATDPPLPAHFHADDLAGKAACKAALQTELGLPVRPDVPLVGLVARFVAQKGIDFFAEALDALLPLDLQFAVLGSGDGWAEHYFTRLTLDTRHFKARFGYQDRLAHLIYAGADLFIMPSRYEPCGLSQLHSQRYGTLPVARAVGGLKDTVEHGTDGFLFEALSADAVAAAITDAARRYLHGRPQFRAMQRSAMRKQMGWGPVAGQYDALYRLTVARKASRL
jgi:starch synthase